MMPTGGSQERRFSGTFPSTPRRDSWQQATWEAQEKSFYTFNASYMQLQNDDINLYLTLHTDLFSPPPPGKGKKRRKRKLSLRQQSTTPENSSYFLLAFWCVELLCVTIIYRPKALKAHA